MPIILPRICLCVASLFALGHPAAGAQEEQNSIEALRALRKEFQSLELITARQASWIFPVVLPPKVVWRDADAAKKFGFTQGFEVRWFDSNLDEAKLPNKGGRWIALLDGTAPNKTPFRRALTFYALPPKLDGSNIYVPDLTVQLPNFPGADAPPAWREHQAEFDRSSKDFLVKSLMDHEQGAIVVAGIAESTEMGRPKTFPEWTVSMNAQHHLNLKLKLMGVAGQRQPLNLPRKLSTPAPRIRPGSAEESRVPTHAKSVIDKFCQQWSEDTKEPFVTLVAKNGVIVTHASFGRDPKGKSIDLDYRCWVASITKTITAILFSQLVDQGLIELDWTLDRVFPDYPANVPFVPTFRQLLNHTSGLSGHGEWGGMFNPYLENIVLNGIDVNEPGKRHEYCGLGFELAAKAMEITTGKCAARIYHEHLFAPLGLQNIIMGNASSDGEFTAIELAIIGQWLANRGSYGEYQFISPETFQEMLPKSTGQSSVAGEHGLGLHQISHRRQGPPKNPEKPNELLFSENTFGHGSFSGCILVVDPDQQLVIVQARKQFRPEDNKYWSQFFQVVADAIKDEKQ
ncbi:MAG: serine hydrolase domain-containing protein [Pirellula sp.]|jgi:CubicO group peptidase (beta-lactamase class C family)|nr:beta-lactamase family protein [Pirellula sp.]